MYCNRKVSNKPFFVCVLGSEVNDAEKNQNGKKKRKRKRSQKQLERWRKYREKKYLEKARSYSPYIDVNKSSLRAEAPEFVPRSLATSLSQQNEATPNADADIPEGEAIDAAAAEKETTAPVVVVEATAEANQVEVESHHTDDVDDVNETTEASALPKLDGGDDDDMGVFGSVLAIYASSELHGVTNTVSVERFLRHNSSFGNRDANMKILLNTCDVHLAFTLKLLTHTLWLDDILK